MEPERANIAFFEALPVNDRARVDFANVRGVQFLEPLFEFSGACAGCGETPYLKLLSQLFGDRLQVANATGCSSIYGGNLPVTPWTKNHEGRGPAWSNSLFEDNAEFGLGFRLAADKHLELAQHAAARSLRPRSARSSSHAILAAPQMRESEIRAQRVRVAELEAQVSTRRSATNARAETCSRSSIIWSGAASGSSAATAGPTTSAMAGSTTCWRAAATSTCWCSTPRSIPTPAARRRRRRRSARSPSSPPPASASRARTWRCRRSPTAMSTSRRSRWAPIRSRPCRRSARPRPMTGPSLILAYSHCIAHGIDMRIGMRQQDLAVASGYWPLFRFNPAMRTVGENPFRLDSPRPTIPFKDYAYNEIRYTLARAHRPDEAQRCWRRPSGSWREVSAVRGPGRPRRQPFPSGRQPLETGWAPSVTLGATEHRMDLTTRYLGLRLRNPLVASASPLNADLGNTPPARGCRSRRRRAALAVRGADRAERREFEHRSTSCRRRQLRGGADLFPASRDAMRLGPDALSRPRAPRARRRVDIPVIASLNGTTDAGWIDYARRMEEAGADGSNSTSTSSRPT